MDRFNICQAYAQLEADYNVGGWLRERPSNQRRRESIGCQLARIGFSNPHGWVDTEADAMQERNAGETEMDEEEVREVYYRAVLRWNLPIDETLMQRIKEFFVPDFIAKYPQCAGPDYKQGR